MKISFILDSDKEFTAFAQRNLTIFGYQVYTYSNPQEFLEGLKLNPQLIIVGESSGDSKAHLEYVSRSRMTLPKSTIIQVARPNEFLHAESSIKAGASEFIEKDSATFVRLRTSLDASEKEILRQKKSIIHNLKKALLG